MTFKEVLDVEDSSAMSDSKFKEVLGLPKKQPIEANERNNWTYECFICHENFATYDNFKKHISSVHGVTLMSKEEPVPKAIETGIVLSIDQAAAVMFVKKTKVSEFGTSERFFYQFPKPLHEFELLPGASRW